MATGTFLVASKNAAAMADAASACAVSEPPP